MQEVIDEYMARAAAATHSADAPDDEDDPDETQEDFNSFKAWLDTLNEGEPVTSKPPGKPTPAVEKKSHEAPPPEEASRVSKDTPTCQLCKKYSSECYLMCELLELRSFCDLCLGWSLFSYIQYPYTAHVFLSTRIYRDYA